MEGLPSAHEIGNTVFTVTPYGLKWSDRRIESLILVREADELQLFNVRFGSIADSKKRR